MRELGIRSPLLELGLTKREVRALAAEYGISVADRPSAPCLATRFPYGTRLSAERMRQVDEGERFLRSLGFYNVRLRAHGDTARIEVDRQDMGRILEHAQEIAERIRALDFPMLRWIWRAFAPVAWTETCRLLYNDYYIQPAACGENAAAGGAFSPAVRGLYLTRGLLENAPQAALSPLRTRYYETGTEENGFDGMGNTNEKKQGKISENSGSYHRLYAGACRLRQNAGNGIADGRGGNADGRNGKPAADEEAARKRGRRKRKKRRPFP